MADDLFSDVEPIPADPDADSHADVDFDAPDLGDERGDGNDPFTVISKDQIENADKLIADGQVQEALIQYRSAVRKANEKGEDDTEQRIDLGDAYVYSGQGLNAFRQYRRAIKTAPQRAEPHFAMGELYMYYGRLQPAIFEFRKAVALGGTLTGEHGVGLLKRQWLKEELGEKQWQLQWQIKKLFDPNNILNPGKVFDPSHIKN